MKTTKHVEQLLRQGRNPKELVKLGFPKSVVTRVRRQLKDEKAGQGPKVAKGRAEVESHPEPSAVSPDQMAVIQQKLQSMANELEKVSNLTKAMSEVTVLMAAARELGTYRRETCEYQENGLCLRKTWTSEDEIPQGIGEPVAGGDDESKWYIKPSPFYCAVCTAFLEDRMDDVEDSVSSDPLSGVKYRFACNDCGSRGWIAAAIKCTKCGRITYWGWVPKKG